MNLIFFGTQDWAARLLECVVEDGFFRVVGVVTQPDKPVGRKSEVISSPVKRSAIALGLTVLQPKKLTDEDFLKRMRELKPQIALVIAYGKILPQTVINMASFGFINVHPSLLPRWRGPSPIQSAISAGDVASGVTIMKIDDQMDHGPILTQYEIRITQDETPLTFIDKVLFTVQPVLSSILQQYTAGSLMPIEQEHGKAIVCKTLSREDGRIDWSESVETIERKIRAYHPWPGTWTTMRSNGKILRLKILQAKLAVMTESGVPGTVFSEDNRLFVATGLGVLELISVQPEGKMPLPAQAFLSGYRQILKQGLGESALPAPEEK